MLVLAPLGAHADPELALRTPAAPGEAYTFGARVGGYGFRQVTTDGGSGWTDCRMNGLGVFGERTLGEHLFVEAGLDLYFSADEPAMDRTSGLLTVAAGARMFPHALVSPYLQLGAGLELSRVRLLQRQLEDSFVLPVAFLGVGGDLKLGDHLRLGLNLRSLVMQNFATSDQAGSLRHATDLAAQIQLYAKYAI